jgi:uncharacterized membrane protein YkoI
LKVAIYLSILICLLKLPTLVFANQKVEVKHYQAQQLVQSGQILSLDVTLTGVQAICHGKLLDAHLYQQSESLHYKLQIMTSTGKVVEINLDASNGQLINSAHLPSICIVETR